MSRKHDTKFLDIGIQIDVEDATTPRDILSALRRGLLHTHRLEEVTDLDSLFDDPSAVTIRLIGIKNMIDASAGKVLFPQSKRALSLTAQCDLLDELRIPNGVKAISIALHQHWSVELQATYGKHANPSTIKRWRIQRARGWRPFLTRRRNRSSMHTEIQQVRAKFAAQTVCNGMTVTNGYRAAVREVDHINSKAHSTDSRPDVQRAGFSYATFARDCRLVRERIGRPYVRRQTGR